MDTILSHFSEDSCFSLVVWVSVLFCLLFSSCLHSVYSVTLFLWFTFSSLVRSFLQMFTSCRLIFKWETKKHIESPKCVDWA